MLKFFNQQAANSKISDQNNEILFGENIIHYQIGNAYLQYEMKIEKFVALAANRVLVDGNAIRLVNNASAYCFKEARLSMTGGSDIEHNHYCGQVSTIMGALTSKVEDLLSHFEKSDESRDEIGNTSQKTSSY